MQTALLAFALAVPPFDGGRPSAAEATTESRDGAALDARLQHIEAAFREGDAARLRASFASRARVRVELPELRDGRGSYGCGQLQMIFGRIFGDVRTRDFSFAADAVAVPEPGTAFARGRWVRVPRPGGPELNDVLTFTLREEGGDWRILEIRASR